MVRLVRNGPGAGRPRKGRYRPLGSSLARHPGPATRDHRSDRGGRSAACGSPWHRSTRWWATSPGTPGASRSPSRQAAAAGADIALVPELALTGYPPEDLLLRPGFARDAQRALREVAAEVPAGLVALIGAVEWDGDCYNSAAVVADGRVQAVYRKRYLPNYGVFDEARYFQAGSGPLSVEIRGARVGVVICEDIWYPGPISGDLATARLDLVCCLSASPYHVGKGARREGMLATRAGDCSAALAFCNQVGGQDELLFDGRSVVLDASGEVVARAPQFREHLLIADVEPSLSARRRLREPLVRRLAAPDLGPLTSIVVSPSRNGSSPAPPAPPAAPLDAAEEVWSAVVLGLRDYVEKNGFPGVVLGLSGGIDSAVTAALACDALGPARVTGVAMPSRYSAPESLGGAQALAEALGIRLIQLPIGVGGRRPSRRRWPRPSPAASRTSPRRTSRRAPAAPC